VDSASLCVISLCACDTIIFGNAKRGVFVGITLNPLDAHGGG
jgi:hypothetical protein